MNYFEAHKLLDRVKDGQTFSRASIDRALCLTGDLDESLCPFSDDEGVVGLHQTQSEGIARFGRNVERPSPFGERTD